MDFHDLYKGGQEVALQKTGRNFHDPRLGDKARQPLGISRLTCYNDTVKPVAETTPGPADPFAVTQWSVIIAAGDSQTDPQGSHSALAQLCQTYWPPLYGYARARGYSVHDAQDLTQGFFAFLLEHKIYKRVAPEKGKFRSFLLASFKNFLCDAHDRTQALKRGGGCELLPLEESRAKKAEALFQTHSSSGTTGFEEDRIFERAWADTLVAKALAHLAASYHAEGKQALFDQLKAFLTLGVNPPPTYRELAERLDTTESTVRSYVTRLRARYRDILRAEVRCTVAHEAEVDSELRELLRVLTNG